MPYSVIEVKGGIGKQIMATAVCSAIKSAEPERDLIVISAYPAVYVNNPDVYRVLPIGGAPYFYEDYVRGQDTKFFCQEPYLSDGYLRAAEHLTTAWCKTCGVQPGAHEGRIFLTDIELSRAANKIKIAKPLMLFQPFGGPSSQKLAYNWNRDIPPAQAQAIANALATKYHVVQPVREGQIALANVEPVTLPLRELFALVSMASNVLSIDSVLHHAAAALKVANRTTCWVSTSPTIFGYAGGVDIMPAAPLKDHMQSVDGYFHEFDFSGNRDYDFPFSTVDIFNVDEIIKAVL